MSDGDSDSLDATASEPCSPAPQPRRLVYFGTPALSVAPLVALHEAGFEIELVVSAEDKRRGRGATMMPSPVKRAALDLGLAVTAASDDVLATSAEAAVVVAYGRLIKPHLLARMPMVNLHVSLLPRWRGAAPIERAILAGDERTGVCVMEVAEALDSGGVYAVAETDVDHKTCEELRRELVGRGTELLIDVLHRGLGSPEPQRGEVTYASKIDPRERRLDWTLPAVQLDRVVRIGGAWTTFRGRRLKVIEALDVDVGPLEALPPVGGIVGESIGTSHRMLRLVTVQPEGKAPMPVRDWLNGTRPTTEDRLGT